MGNYHGETPLKNEYTPKNERQKCKTDPVRGWVVVEGRKVNKEGEGRKNVVNVLYGCVRK
jgi:hypothetical protein